MARDLRHLRHQSANQLTDIDQLATSPAASASSGSLRSRTNLRGAVHWASKFDVVEVLGGEGEDSYRPNTGTYGHTGCVNALNWSPDGTLLASGSDDTRVCLWKLGQEPDTVNPGNAEATGRYPPLGLGLSSVIHTGHRANIFSVKFAPTTNNIIFTASGDHEVRVFDIHQASASAEPFKSINPHGSITREWTEYARNSGVCTRVLQCHRGRVKRIATEGNSDAVFLTCSEDGTVRQHDLRVGHTCRTDCPPPLCSYRSLGLGLYSLTTSPIRPELFVVAGTSPYAFLHDRRMTPKTMKEWGVRLSPTELTQCVRRFGPPQPPLVPALDESPSEEEEIDPTNPDAGAERLRRVQRQRARLRERNRSRNEKHVTAAKLSSTNGRELLLTYSGGPVALYDIFDTPETPQSRHARPEANSNEERLKGKKAASVDKNGDIRVTEMLGSTASTRTKQSPFVAGTVGDIPGLSTDENDLANGSSNGSAEPVHSLTSASTTPQAVPDTARTQELRESLRRSPLQEVNREETGEGSVPEVPIASSRPFEIRVGEDGDLEVDIGPPPPAGMEDPSASEAGTSGSEDVEMNTEGYQALLRNIEAQRQSLRELGDHPTQAQLTSMGGATGAVEESDEGTEDDDENDDDEDEGEDEDEDEDDISSSDDLEDDVSPQEREFDFKGIPLVRPQKVYSGHRNVDTVKDVNFAGLDNMVVSGSDDGNVFIYRKDTSELIGIWEGDGSVVNVMQYHPELPIMAVSGIDNSVKILAPTTTQNEQGESKVPAYTKRKYSRLEKKEDITTKNQDPSWTSERLAMPSSVLINLINRAAAADDEDEDEEGDEEGRPRRRRRIPLATLIQLAGEGNQDQDCIIM